MTLLNLVKFLYLLYILVLHSENFRVRGYRIGSFYFSEYNPINLAHLMLILMDITCTLNILRYGYMFKIGYVNMQLMY